MAKSSGKAAGKSSGKRTLIAPNGDKRYIRRDKKGRITESDDQGRSLSQDIKKSAKTKAKPGYGDQGDGQPKKATAKKSTSKKAAAKKSTSSKKASSKGK